MNLDTLLDPIDAQAPCGPDLDEIGDDEYLNYVLSVEDRLPGRFLDPQGVPFDRSRIDLRSELDTIGRLLEKSRDLRLLTLEARFQIVSGQIVGFCEALVAAAELVSRFWDNVHPQAYDGDFTLRQNTLGALDDRATVVLPLQFATIVRDKRLGQISYRTYAVATGSAPPRPDEAAADPEELKRALADPANRQQVEAVHAALQAATKALATMRGAFIKGGGHESAPQFNVLPDAIADIVDLIEQSVPVLAGAPADAGTANAAGGETTAGDATAPDVAANGATPAAGPAPAIATHAAAAAALFAAERYFSAAEPSAPALILVHQARMLLENRSWRRWKRWRPKRSRPRSSASTASPSSRWTSPACAA